MSEDYHESVSFDVDIYQNIKDNFSHKFQWVSFDVELPESPAPMNFNSYEEAYHQLMMEWWNYR